MPITVEASVTVHADAPLAPALIDGWMPRWDAVERHSCVVRAPVERIWPLLRTMDFRRSASIRGLFALRSLPALLSPGGKHRKGLGYDLDALLRSGFVLLEVREGAEVLLGVVGRFWTPAGGIERVTPAEFAAWERPGFARGVWSFTATPSADGAHTTVATETRVQCTDAESRRSFLRYWRFVGPFSGLIRREMLRAIRNAAERG